jgi:hypothetical protein
LTQASHLILKLIPKGHGLKCKHKTIKVLGEKSSGLGLGKEFLDLTSKSQSIRGKTDKINFI